MSSINARSTSTIDLLARPSLNDPRKVNKHTDPLRAANPGPLSQADKTKEGAEQARQAAEGLVSTSFVEPILKQARESNHAPPPFGPSRTEKQFGALLDTRLSDELVRAANFPLVERITAQLQRNMPDADAGDQHRVDINA